jgi:hypothetical protein
MRRAPALPLANIPIVTVDEPALKVRSNSSFIESLILPSPPKNRAAWPEDKYLLLISAYRR